MGLHCLGENRQRKRGHMQRSWLDGLNLSHKDLGELHCNAVSIRLACNQIYRILFCLFAPPLWVFSYQDFGRGMLASSMSYQRTTAVLTCQTSA